MDMINHLVAAQDNHVLLQKLKIYQQPELLFCDEIGYLPLGQQGSNLFFQVISARHEQKSTIITTNLLCGAPHNRFNAELIVMRSQLFASPAHLSFRCIFTLHKRAGFQRGDQFIGCLETPRA